MVLKKIITEWLIKNGYDGLCYEDLCWCALDPCDWSRNEWADLDKPAPRGFMPCRGSEEVVFCVAGHVVRQKSDHHYFGVCSDVQVVPGKKSTKCPWETEGEAV